ncbi:MAG: hypothetical protein ACT443_05350, partial [Gemmatimonadota bacterium]
MDLFQELRRRKVVRTTVAYLAAAFVAAQATQLLVDGLDLGSWVLQTVIIIELIALPLVVGLAWAFDLTPEGVERTALDPERSTVALPWRRIALPVTASAMLLLAALAFLSLDEPSTLDADLVAVMPFHVSGDPQIAYLRDGMVDLLAAKLTGQGGPRAADPRAVMSAARQTGEEVDDAAAAEIARSIGAGQALVGSVVGTSSQFTIHAKLMRVPGGRVIAEAEETTNPGTLLSAIDRLAARLLSLQAGESLQRLEVLTTTSLPALRVYLEGQSEYRSSHFGRASELFARAVELDTTFALAALGYSLAVGWGEGSEASYPRSVRVMRAHKDRLGPVDRLMITATVGEAGVPRTWAQRFAAFDSLVSMAPDRADAWMLYADHIVHFGQLADRDAFGESQEMFNRIVAIDSSFTPALLHLIDIAMREERAAEVRRLEAIRQVRDPDGSAALYQRPWRIRALADTAAIEAEGAALDTMSAGRLWPITWLGLFAPNTVADAVR